MRRERTGAPRALRALGLAAAAFVLARPAHASVQNVYGIGGRAPALAGAVTASVRGADSAYYNPAGLARSERFAVGFGASGIRLAVDPLSPGAPAEDVLGITLGVEGVVPLGGPLRDRVWYGALAYIPTEEARLVRLVLSDIGDPFYLPYTSASERLVLSPGLGFVVTEWLRVGASIDYFPFDSPNLEVGGPSRTGDFEVSGDLALIADITPRFGLLLELGDLVGALDGWTLGASYRGEFEADFALPAAFDLGLDLGLIFEGQSFFAPEQVALGVAWRPSPAWTLSADLVWQGWSGMPSPRVRVKVAGLDSLIPLPTLGAVENELVSPDLSDTLSPRLGVEFRPADPPLEIPVTLRAGYRYEPSAGTPDGDPLLFTNPRHVIGTGLEIAPAGPEVGGTRIDVVLDLFLQVHLLEEQVRTPLGVGGTPGDPVRGGGTVVTGGFFLRFALDEGPQDTGPQDAEPQGRETPDGEP